MSKKENKISVKFFRNHLVRAVWNNDNNKWYFSVLDVIGAIRKEGDYTKNRNYWKYLKAKLKQKNSQLVSSTTQLKLEAKDGKKYKSDCLDSEGICVLSKEFPSNAGAKFLDWFIGNENSIDSKSREKAYELFDKNLIDDNDIGKTKSLLQIHGFIFAGLYDFAGKVREKTISKNGFMFANALYLKKTLEDIEKMSENNFTQIIDKYIEMNIAHPFMEGNGRATRIWLDLILKKRIKKCIDWSKIEKKIYLCAMKESVSDGEELKKLLESALTDKIDDREVFMKGIDYSYYYEEID